MADLLEKTVNGVINLVDVDGVVRKVDVDDAIQRIDMNELLDKVDMNRLIDRVDLNRQLDRVDLNRALDRVDVNAVVMRSDLGAIITHSTTGIFSDILDAVRASVVHFDIWIYNSVCFIMRRDWTRLPPVPGERRRRKKPASEMALSTSVQGCFSGVVSKGLAILIDTLLVTFSFALWLVLVAVGWKALTQEDERVEFKRNSRYGLAAYAVYWFAYFWFWTVVAHRTLGMAIVGLKVTDNNTGHNITAKQGFVRTAFLPLSAIFAMALVVVGLVRQDGRMLHDVVAGTGIVFKWNAAMAKFRAHAEQQQEEAQADSASSSSVASTVSNTRYSSFEDAHQRVA